MEKKKEEKNGFGKAPIHFTGIRRLMIIRDDPGNRYGGWVFSVTLSGQSKVQIRVFNRENKQSDTFSFYLVSVMKLIHDTIERAGKDSGVFNMSLEESKPEWAMRAGQLRSASLVMGIDQKGAYIGLSHAQSQLPLFRIKPLPFSQYTYEGKIQIHEDMSSTESLILYLRMFARSVQTVSDVLAVKETNAWTPPEESEIIDESKT
jgi:hypothetical protein